MYLSLKGPKFGQLGQSVKAQAPLDFVTVSCQRHIHPLPTLPHITPPLMSRPKKRFNLDKVKIVELLSYSQVREVIFFFKRYNYN